MRQGFVALVLVALIVSGTGTANAELGDKLEALSGLKGFNETAERCLQSKCSDEELERVRATLQQCGQIPDCIGYSWARKRVTVSPRGPVMLRGCEPNRPC